jgi:hypothetical protein
MIMIDAAKAEFGVALSSQEVDKRFPGALGKLKEQRQDPFHGLWVKICGLGDGMWLFGVRGGKLTLFNSVLHGTKLSETTVYATVYVWNEKEWI